MLLFESLVARVLNEFTMDELRDPETSRIRGTSDPTKVKRANLTQYLTHVTGGKDIFHFMTYRHTDKVDETGRVVEPAGTKTEFEAILDVPRRYVKGTGTEAQSSIHQFRENGVLRFLAKKKNGTPYPKASIRSTKVENVIWVSAGGIRSEVID